MKIFESGDGAGDSEEFPTRLADLADVPKTVRPIDGASGQIEVEDDVRGTVKDEIAAYIDAVVAGATAGGRVGNQFPYDGRAGGVGEIILECLQ